MTSVAGASSAAGAFAAASPVTAGSAQLARGTTAGLAEAPARAFGPSTRAGGATGVAGPSDRRAARKSLRPSPAWTSILDRRRPADGSQLPPSTAELADCSCPEFCERDHEND